MLIGCNGEGVVQSAPGGAMQTLQALVSAIGPNSTHVQQVAVICRSKVTVFEAAVLVARNPYAYFGFVGGVEHYTDTVKQVTLLYRGDRTAITKKFLLLFASFAALKTYTQEAGDAELSSVVAFVERHGDQVEEKLERIVGRVSKHPRHAHFLLTTVHKCKGMEFDNVILADDFFDYDPNLDGEDEEEVNIMYVACTRAKRTLTLNSTMGSLLTDSGGLHRIALSLGSGDGAGNENGMKCVQGSNCDGKGGPLLLLCKSPTVGDHTTSVAEETEESAPIAAVCGHCYRWTSRDRLRLLWILVSGSFPIKQID
jgi:hypothetical protein